jgi:hypothetical protein
MKKHILGLAAAAVIAIPLAVAGTASAAPAPLAFSAGAVAWDFNHGQVTGTVVYNANNKTGGTLDYKASNGMWLHGVVTPDSYQKIDAHTAVFAGEITRGSDDFTVSHEGTDYFTVKVVDGGIIGRNGDVIAVLANQDGNGKWLTAPDATTTRDYPMTAETAGIVTAGNLIAF